MLLFSLILSRRFKNIYTKLFPDKHNFFKFTVYIELHKKRVFLSAKTRNCGRESLRLKTKRALLHQQRPFSINFIK